MTVPCHIRDIFDIFIYDFCDKKVYNVTYGTFLTYLSMIFVTKLQLYHVTYGTFLTYFSMIFVTKLKLYHVTYWTLLTYFSMIFVTKLKPYHVTYGIFLTYFSMIFVTKLKLYHVTYGTFLTLDPPPPYRLKSRGGDAGGGWAIGLNPPPRYRQIPPRKIKFVSPRDKGQIKCPRQINFEGFIERGLITVEGALIKLFWFSPGA